MNSQRPRVIQPKFRAALSAVVWFSASLVAAAQNQAADPEPSSAHAREELSARNRSFMHPGDPLKIVGLEQGEKSHRADTPALLNSTASANVVEQEELYRRTLAIYDRGATFHEPLPTAGEPDSNGAQPNSSAARAPTVVTSPINRAVAWFVGIAITALLIAFIAKRYRSMFVPPQDERRAIV